MAFVNVVRFLAASAGAGDFVVSSAVTGYQTPTLAGATNGATYSYRAESSDLTQWEIGTGTWTEATSTFSRSAVLFNSSGTGTGSGQTGAGTVINFTVAPQVAFTALAEDLASSAIISAQYLVAVATGDLSAERVTTDTATVAWDHTTAAQAKANVPDDAITFAKMQNITTDRLLGRDTAATGNVEELTVGGGIEFTGSTGIQTSAFTGDVTKSAGGTATTIANDAVTFAKMQDIATDRLLGRDTASSGNVEELTVGGGLEFTGSAGIQRSALTGDVTASAGSNSTTVANDAVTNAKMADMAQSTLKGRAAGAGTGDPTDLTEAQVKTLLNYPTSTTDNRLPKFNGTGGNLEETGITVDDSNNVSGINNLAALGASWVLLQSAVASTSATIDLETGVGSTYDNYAVVYDSVAPATDGAGLIIRVKVAGAYLAGASDYAYALNRTNSDGTTGVSNSTGTTGGVLNTNIGNAADEAVGGEVLIFNVNNTARKKLARVQSSNLTDAGTFRTEQGGIQFNTASALQGFRFLMSTGNIGSGNFYLYGIRRV